MTRWLAMGLVVAGLAMPAAARAQDSGIGFFPLLHYGITGGGMFPAGPQGDELHRGTHIGGEIYGESGLGVQLGVESSFTASPDPRETRITHVGVLSRLSPSPEDYRLYVQLGLGGYSVSYSAGTPRLASVFRPGGSFAIGAEVIQFGSFSLGGSGAYHGIILQSHKAIAYAAVRLHLTYQRSGL